MIGTHLLSLTSDRAGHAACARLTGLYSTQIPIHAFQLSPSSPSLGLKKVSVLFEVQPQVSIPFAVCLVALIADISAQAPVSSSTWVAQAIFQTHLEMTFRACGLPTNASYAWPLPT